MNWRKKYNTYQTISRLVNTKAETAKYLGKFSMYINYLICTYGAENVKTVVAYTIRFRNLKVPNYIKVWSESAEPIYQGDTCDKRDFHELRLVCNPAIIIEIAKRLYLKELQLLTSQKSRCQ